MALSLGQMIGRASIAKGSICNNCITTLPTMLIGNLVRHVVLRAHLESWWCIFKPILELEAGFVDVCSLLGAFSCDETRSLTHWSPASWPCRTCVSPGSNKIHSSGKAHIRQLEQIIEMRHLCKLLSHKWMGPTYISVKGGTDRSDVDKCSRLANIPWVFARYQWHARPTPVAIHAAAARVLQVLAADVCIVTW